MSRLKFPYHFEIDKFIGFLLAWENTPENSKAGWRELAATQPDSTQAIVYSVWWTINKQINIPTILNPFYIQWQYRNVEIGWPYGTKNIPVGICGNAICGWSVCGLDYENAIA